MFKTRFIMTLQLNTKNRNETHVLTKLYDEEPSYFKKQGICTIDGLKIDWECGNITDGDGMSFFDISLPEFTSTQKIFGDNIECDNGDYRYDFLKYLYTFTTDDEEDILFDPSEQIKKIKEWGIFNPKRYKQTSILERLRREYEMYNFEEFEKDAVDTFNEEKQRLFSCGWVQDSCKGIIH